MQSDDKAVVLKGLKAAQEASLRGQDPYRVILKAIAAAPVNDAILADQLEALGWERIEQHMTGECWPPCSEDWLKIKGLDWFENPKYRLLDQITA